MASTRILCVGNAVVDSRVRRGAVPPTPDAVAGMRAAGRLGAAMADLYGDPAGLAPGGSAANTAAELARLGVEATFVGLAGDDHAGRLCRRSLEAAGARWATPLAAGRRTSRIHLFVDAAGERSFVAELDACRDLAAGHVLAELGRPVDAVLAEAYLLEGPSGAFDGAVEVARVTGALCAVTLGSPTAAARHAALLRELADVGLVDLLIGNEEEFGAFADGAEPLSAMSDLPCACVMTRGGRAPLATRGASIVKGGVPPSVAVLDTTGAGDAFAAGALSVLAADGTLADAMDLGSRLGSEAVTRVGARAVVVE